MPIFCLWDSTTFNIYKGLWDAYFNQLNILLIMFTLEYIWQVNFDYMISPTTTSIHILYCYMGKLHIPATTLSTLFAYFFPILHIGPVCIGICQVTYRFLLLFIWWPHMHARMEWMDVFAYCVSLAWELRAMRSLLLSWFTAGGGHWLNASQGKVNYKYTP